MSHPKSYWLKEARLLKGSHQPNGEACVMEAASQLLNEKWTDHPVGVDPQIAAFCRAVNDRFGDDVRAELQKRLPRIIKAKHLPDKYRFRWARFAPYAAYSVADVAAADAAADAADAAADAGADDALIALLTDAQAELRDLIGYDDVCEITDDRVERLGVLVGTR